MNRYLHYKETADYDRKNLFDVEKYVNRKLQLKADEEYEVIDMG